MTFRIKHDDPVTTFLPCSCWGPHRLAVYIDDEDGMVTLIDEHIRLSDALDLRSVWQRIKSAVWILTGKHHGYAEATFHGDGLERFGAVINHGLRLQRLHRQADEIKEIMRKHVSEDAPGTPHNPRCGHPVHLKAANLARAQLSAQQERQRAGV